MRCAVCQTGLHPGDTFCPTCGERIPRRTYGPRVQRQIVRPHLAPFETPRLSALPVPWPEPGWELCDISYRVVRGRLFGSRGFRFKAWAIGPGGNRPVSESEPFTSDPRQENGARAAFDDLVSQLRANGWEETGERGIHWYSVRFRRRA